MKSSFSYSKIFYFFVFLNCFLMACQPPPQKPTKSIDLQGHRGCRGLLPENSIPAMLHALQLGVSTLELDVVISKDKQVVVSHEPFFSPEICTGPGDSEISDDHAAYNMYAMDYAEIKAFDCGSKFVERFPDQQKMPTFKPLLSDLIEAVEVHARENEIPAPHYNIETKISPKGDDLFHPQPGPFVELLMKVIQEKGISSRTTIQSFDIRSLQYTKQAYPDMELVLLVENEDSMEANLEKLGFVPAVYSPYFPYVNSDLVQRCHAKGMKIIPWTVNKAEDIRQMLDLEVDGIISDYPDRLISIVNDTKHSSE